MQAAQSELLQRLRWGGFVQSLLFELRGNDPVIMIAAISLLALVVFVAGFIPAYRPSRVHPMEALRYE